MIRLVIGLLMIAYVWFIYGMLLTKKDIDYKHNESVSVVVPCYNESKQELINCIDSIFGANGEKQVVLINNNSNKKYTLDAYQYLVDKYPNMVFVNQFRQGKRFAHSKGLEWVDNDIVIFVDSDTVIDKNAIIEIIKPFKDKNVGGVAGKVLVSNKKDNFLTRSINAMFWTSSSIFRNATGNLGFMQVSPGALSAYRKESLLKIEDKYVNQKFMGRQCAISDDRFLTIRIQTLLGQKMTYVDNAVSYTIMPKTFFGFWKVLERWKRGVIREVLIFWKQPKKKAKLLFFDTQFNFIMMNIMFLFKILMIYELIVNFSFIGLSVMLMWIMLMSLFYGGHMITNNPKEFGYKVLYTLFYEFFLSFTYFNALWNLRDQGAWKTR